MYHVTLDGQGYLLNLARYQRRVARPFAGKTRQGDASYADLSLEQVWSLSNWSMGQSASDGLPDGAGTFLEYLASAPGRYRSGLGLDGFTVPGSLRLGPDLVSTSPVGNNAYRVLQPYRGKLYAGTGDGKSYQLTPPSTWALSRDHAKAGGVTSYAIYNGKLYAANGTDGVVDKFDGTTWTAATFTQATVTGIRAMAVRDPTTPTLYVAGSEVAGARVARWNDATLSATLYTLQEADCYAMVCFEGDLWLFGADANSGRGGVYRYDGSNWVRWLDLPDNYVTVAAVWDGVVWLGCGLRGELWSFDGSGAPSVVAADLTAPGDELRGLAAWRGALWVSVRPPQAGQLRLKRYDGSSWSEPAGGTAIDASATAARGLAVLSGKLYAAGEKTASSAPVVVADATVYPSAARTLESVLFSAGLGEIAKVFRSVTVAHAALMASQSIEVQYRLEDTGSWTSLGTSATVGATSATMTFPMGAVGKLLALRVILRGTASATPALYEVLVRYVLAPSAKREWELALRLEGSPGLPLVRLDGTAEPKSGTELSAALWASRVKSGPLALQDLDGSSYSVWFVELEEAPAELSQRRGYATVGKCRLVEA